MEGIDATGGIHTAQGPGIACPRTGPTSRARFKIGGVGDDGRGTRTATAWFADSCEGEDGTVGVATDIAGIDTPVVNGAVV